MSEQEFYEIRIKGRIDQRWAVWFDGLVWHAAQLVGSPPNVVGEVWHRAHVRFV